MSKDVFDYDLDDYLKDESSFCKFCDDEIELDKEFCSERCCSYYNNE